MAAAGVDFDAALCKVVLDTLVFVGLPLQMGRFLWASLCALPDGYMKQQILFALGELAWAPREPGAADSDETRRPVARAHLIDHTPYLWKDAHLTAWATMHRYGQQLAARSPIFEGCCLLPLVALCDACATPTDAACGQCAEVRLCNPCRAELGMCLRCHRCLYRQLDIVFLLSDLRRSSAAAASGVHQQLEERFVRLAAPGQAGP
jgi:hypothetical protein